MYNLQSAVCGLQSANVIHRIPTKQARETEAPATDTSVYDSYILVLKLDKLGFQPSKQGRQDLPGLILQSIMV